MRPTWAQHALNIAAASALRSEDPYCRVGACVLAADGVVLGVGYNGTVAGLEIDWRDREHRRPYVIHAEQNALRYTTPHRAHGGTMGVTHFPCSACIMLAASYGVKEVVWHHPPDWARYPAALTEGIARRVGITLTQMEATNAIP